MKKILSIITIIIAALVLSINQPVHYTGAATVTTGVTFTTNQLVQYYDLNNAVNNATISAIVSGDITDGTIAAVDLGANSVTTAKVLDGTIIGADIASRTLSTSLYATNSVDDIALSTNQVIRSGFWFFTNVNQSITFNGPSTTLTFSSNQINWAAVSGVTNSAGVADAGKVVKLNDSGVLSTTITPFSGAFTSTNLVITAAAQVVNAHGLGAMPSLVQGRLKCTSADLSYSSGDEVIIHLGNYDSAGGFGVSVVPDATNITLRYSSTANVFQLVEKSTGNVGTIDATKWVFIVRAFK